VTYRVDRLLRKARDDEVVRVQGTIRTVRKQKYQAFAAITDGSSPRKLQVLMTPEQAAP
jgi:aspartyl/asparaginyl-tRNA synthetase